MNKPPAPPVPPPLPDRARQGAPGAAGAAPAPHGGAPAPGAPAAAAALTAAAAAAAPGAGLPPPRAPMPTDEGVMSTRAKMSLADFALGLREEQLAAHVVHYKAELQTSPELDQVTAQVVAELKALQQAQLAAQRAATGGSVRPPSQPPTAQDRAQVEIELIQSLKTMLARLFRPEKVSSIIERKLAEATKRFARLFFESELHEKIRGSATEMKTMRYSEQALFHVLQRNEQRLAQELAAFEYRSPEVLADAKETLADWIKELRNEFLGRTTPELNALVKLLTETLARFFTQELPPSVGELAWEVVKEGRLGDSKIRAGYKISAETFPRFRQAFERRFIHRLVPYAEEAMLKSVRASEKFRVETIRFVADPHIFSDVCELVCDAVYDYLYNDGFLDLPQDWRARLTRGD